MIALTPPGFLKPDVAAAAPRRWPALDPLEVLPPLTLLHLLVHAPESWYLQIVILPLFVLGLIFRTWLKTPAFWYVTAALFGGTIYLNWESSDNHKYLFVYWCLALCCTFSLRKGERHLALGRTSRLLIAFCMLLATFWKAATPQYMDCRFFTFELLCDDRFAYFTSWTTGLPLETLAANRELRDLLMSTPEAGLSIQAVELAGVSQVAWLAQFLTWWTVIIEGLIGGLFLLPTGKWTNRCRNTLLLIFAITTYSVAPVRGFGWMLMLLGFAQCNDHDRGFRWAYLGALLLIQAYMMPLGDLIGLLMR
jgi:hypothetical protein